MTRPKPRNSYADRRAWQNEARARGETPECGRYDCRSPADPAWLNRGTPLLYCERCARAINSYGSPDGRGPLCFPEAGG